MRGGEEGQKKHENNNSSIKDKRNHTIGEEYATVLMITNIEQHHTSDNIWPTAYNRRIQLWGHSHSKRY